MSVVTWASVGSGLPGPTSAYGESLPDYSAMAKKDALEKAGLEQRRLLMKNKRALHKLPHDRYNEAKIEFNQCQNSKDINPILNEIEHHDLFASDAVKRVRKLYKECSEIAKTGRTHKSLEQTVVHEAPGVEQAPAPGKPHQEEEEESTPSDQLAAEPSPKEKVIAAAQARIAEHKSMIRKMRNENERILRDAYYDQFMNLSGFEVLIVQIIHKFERSEITEQQMLTEVDGALQPLLNIVIHGTSDTRPVSSPKRPNAFSKLFNKFK